MHGAATDVMAVFSQVGQVAEVSKRANHADGLVTRQTFQQFFEGLVGLGVGLAAKSDRQLAHLLDQLIGGYAVLLPNDVAKNPAKQANVFNQWSFVVPGAPGRFVFGVNFSGAPAALGSPFGACGSGHFYPGFRSVFALFPGVSMLAACRT